MTEPELHPLLQRYRRGECTPDELRAVEQWYDALGQDREDLVLTPADEAGLRLSLWQGIGRRIGKSARQQARPGIQAQPWVRWAAAAAVVLGIGIGALLLRPRALPVATRALPKVEQIVWLTHRNGSTKPVSIALQDGSRVRLSPASTLRYPKTFLGTERIIKLEGEGFFEVAHNPARPFRVFTDKIVTTVLGTSFTVRAFASRPEARVVVRTGRVRVTARQAYGKPNPAPDASVVLLPSQQVVYAATPKAAPRPLVAEPAPVRELAFAFNDRPVPEVLAVLEKGYGVTIDYDRAALARCTVTLSLESASLYEKLDLLCKTIKGTYKANGTQIQLLSGGCAGQ